jgi:recombination protein RecA
MSDNIERELIDELAKRFKKESCSAQASFFTDSSTDVKDYVSTGNIVLDTFISNKKNGGIPVGRLTEISGGEGAGKTLMASYILANTQKRGGVAILIDSEHAASFDLMKAAGVNVDKLVYVNAGTVEEVFQTMDGIIHKLQETGSKKLITIVWDSVAGTSTRAEVEGEMGDHTIGLSARMIGKGLRKLTPIISRHNVCLVFINQLRTKIGVVFGDNLDTPGGKAIPFHASVRLRLKHFKEIKDASTKELIGRIVKCDVKKNKIAPPMRSTNYVISWGTKPGAWIDEAETLFLVGIDSGLIKKMSTQKYSMTLPSGKNIEFTKKKFPEILEDDTMRNEVKTLIEDRFIIKGTEYSGDVELSDPEEGE